MRSLTYCNLTNLSSRIIALGSTQPLTETGAQKIFLCSKERPELRPDSLIASFVQVGQKIWDPTDTRIALLYIFHCPAT
jgi:hypothetical protein